MLLRFEHRFCHIAALTGKPAATAAVFWVGTEGGSVMFLSRVYEFGRRRIAVAKSAGKVRAFGGNGAGGSVSPIGGWPAWFFGCGIFQTALEAV